MNAGWSVQPCRRFGTGLSLQMPSIADVVVDGMPDCSGCAVARAALFFSKDNSMSDTSARHCAHLACTCEVLGDQH
jgi:hypothetical protein